MAWQCFDMQSLHDFLEKFRVAGVEYLQYLPSSPGVAASGTRRLGELDGSASTCMQSLHGRIHCWVAGVELSAGVVYIVYMLPQHFLSACTL